MRNQITTHRAPGEGRAAFSATMAVDEFDKDHVSISISEKDADGSRGIILSGPEVLALMSWLRTWYTQDR